MKFGSVDNADNINFDLPKDHDDSVRVLGGEKKAFSVFVGCAKWNKEDLKNFYPRGTKDELTYYSQQFNSIELNASFYRLFPAEQFAKWRDKTPAEFKFFPKLTRDISHIRRLKGVEESVDRYLDHTSSLEDKLGACFLQMPENFAPKDFSRLVGFVESWPKDVRLSVELRHTDWFNSSIAEEVYSLFETNGIGNMIVDTAGRRDLLHMRLTTPWVFVRYVGANHKSDYSRLDDWVDRLEYWVENGLTDIYFFIHQNLEVESPLLAAYFIEKLNDRLGTDLVIPGKGGQGSLF